MRCLALAEALIDRDIPCFFQCHGLASPLARRLARAGMPFESLSDVATATEEDADRLLARAGELDARALVVDEPFFFGPSYRLRLREAGVPVLAFDDLALCPAYHADVLVNPAPEAETLPYAQRAPEARLLLGPAYAPLRREFRTVLAAGTLPVSARNAVLLAFGGSARNAVLLTFGGSDPLDVTEPVLDRVLSVFPPDVQVLVAVGGAHSRREDLAARASALPERVEVHVNTSDMAGLMARAGLALTAGGNTLGELAALGVPPVVAICADNQVPATRWACARGLVVAVEARGVARAEVAARVVEAGLTLWRDPARRADIATRGRRVVDGLGAERIAAVLSDLIAGRSV